MTDWRACTVCTSRPCDGVLAGGMCDDMECRYYDDEQPEDDDDDED